MWPGHEDRHKRVNAGDSPRQGSISTWQQVTGTKALSGGDPKSGLETRTWGTPPQGSIDEGAQARKGVEKGGMNARAGSTGAEHE